MPLDATNWSTTPETEIDETTALLFRARGFLERGWCHDALACNFLRLQVSPYSRWAVAWCANGALEVARLTASDLVWRRAITRLVAAIGGESIWQFNDRQDTIEPVLAGFDRAIAASRPEHAPSNAGNAPTGMGVTLPRIFVSWKRKAVRRAITVLIRTAGSSASLKVNGSPVVPLRSRSNLMPRASRNLGIGSPMDNT